MTNEAKWNIDFVARRKTDQRKDQLVRATTVGLFRIVRKEDPEAFQALILMLKEAVE